MLAVQANVKMSRYHQSHQKTRGPSRGAGLVIEMLICHEEQLSQLDSARLDLNHVLDERNQVLDLLSESVKPGTKVTRRQRIEPQQFYSSKCFSGL